MPQRPQFWLSLTKVMLSTHLPWHHAWPAEQLPAPIPGVWGGGVLPVVHASNRTVARHAVTASVLVAIVNKARVRWLGYFLLGNWKFSRMSVSTSTGLPLSS